MQVQSGTTFPFMEVTPAIFGSVCGRVWESCHDSSSVLINTHTSPHTMARPPVDSRARDVRRRVDVIQKKLADLRQLGVVCAFCYTSVRNNGSFFTLGDQRITDVIECHKDEVVQNLLNPDLAPCGEAAGEVHLILPLLPAPLEQLSRRALQSLLVGILKDLGIRWSDPRPEWWPPDVPFVPSCSTPDDFSGDWTKMLQKVIASVYSFFSYDVTTYVTSIMQDLSYSASDAGDPPSPGPTDTPPGSPHSVRTTSEGVANSHVSSTSDCHTVDLTPPKGTAVGQMLAKDISQENPTTALDSSAQMLLTKDGVPLRGLRDYPVARSHPPVQYTKFTVVSASSIASPRRRSATRIQPDKAPSRNEPVRNSPPPLLASASPRQLPLAPPLIPVTSAPVPRPAPVLTPTSFVLASPPPLTPAPLTPAPPRCLPLAPPLTPVVSRPPPPLSNSSSNRPPSNLFIHKSFSAQTKPLLVKDTSRHVHGGALFGRMDFTVPSQSKWQAVSPTKGAEQGAGQRTNKLHFHMMTVVNKAKRTALIKSRELHRLLTSNMSTEGAVSDKSERLAQSSGAGGEMKMADHCCSPSHSGASGTHHPQCRPVHGVASSAQEFEHSPVPSTSEEKVRSSHMMATPQCTVTNIEEPRPRKRGRQSRGGGRGGGSGISGNQRVLTFHAYEDPRTSFKVKKSHQDT